MIYSTGKRKTSIAKVWLEEKAEDTIINQKPVSKYFGVAGLRQKVAFPQSVLLTILNKRKESEINAEMITEVSSVKGNKIPTSFFDYVNSLSAELVLSLISTLNAAKFKIEVLGGGIKGQAEAVMYGISKCLAKSAPEAHKMLKDLGLLTRDPRVTERKKPGLRKARKKEQYSKR